MYRFFFLVAFVATLVLVLSTPAVAASDYTVEEAVVTEGLRSITAGATLGPGGVHYYSLKIHCARDLPSVDCRDFYDLMVAKLDQPFETSGVQARFVLEGPFASEIDSSGDVEEDYVAFKTAYPADGKFGMLLVSHNGPNGGGWAGVHTSPYPNMLLRSVVSLEGWVFVGRPWTAEAVNAPAHELVHNLGGLHDGECPVGQNTEGCGYVNSLGTGDIMSVSGTHRVSRFSDPNAMVEGQAFGDENANLVEFLNARLGGYSAVTAPAIVPCDAGDDRVFFNGGFVADVCWRTSQGNAGTGKLVFTSGESAFLYFFQELNYELMMKVKDACDPPFNSWWVFIAGLTNVEVTVTVTDTSTGVWRTYHNPLNTAFQPVQDTSAFTCD